MKKTILALAIAAIASPVIAGSDMPTPVKAQAASAPKAQNLESDISLTTLNVKFHEAPTEEQIQAVLDVAGATVKSNHSRFKMITIEFDGNPDEIKTAIETLPFVKQVMFDKAIKSQALTTTALPEEDLFSQMWNWHNGGGFIESTDRPNDTNPYLYVNGVDLGALEARRLLEDRVNSMEDIIIAVFDSGVNYNDPALKDMMWVNADEIPDNGIDDDGDSYIDNIYGIAPNKTVSGDPIATTSTHGTQVAGVICEKINNAYAGAGLTPRCKIMAINIEDDNGIQWENATISGIDFVLNEGVKISNFSNSMSGSADETLMASYDAFVALKDGGHLVVAASGNDSQSIDDTPLYPASYSMDNVITVNGITGTGGRATYSNYGAISTDIAAPTNGIVTTSFTSDGSVLTPVESTSFNGTSAATPEVAAVAAALWSLSPSLTYTQVRDYVLNNAQVIPNYTDVRDIEDGGSVLENVTLSSTGGMLDFTASVKALIADIEGNSTKLGVPANKVFESLNFGSAHTP
ncbi:S8 family serine peptidase [Thiomicrorhabdus xiamenensis]|uniref:S8 family serine peptidase n=1 Tax=Thiomicrorhabdus xiamenensis TaxID=2739063 RepID=A0A7D4P4Q3_9GAMM|nr:S8 family serine peptidase [Thiomicrorhabdus xiamenensis]QKI89055.1 S8 family serine peptidase [Thiomicrorhabdus xiamenensis]